MFLIIRKFLNFKKQIIRIKIIQLKKIKTKFIKKKEIIENFVA